MENRREKGKHYEDFATTYLENNGIRVTDRNFRCKIGEIDIVGRDGRTLVFFEVKYRKDLSKGHPANAVNLKKARTICRVADFYRMKNKIPGNVQCRFDVIAILGDELFWYKNAFEYLY